MRKVEAYVEELVSRLHCDPLKRDEIRLEVHLHLRELTDAEVASGRDAEAAQEAAIEQFGPVEEVAARLAEVHDLAPARPIVWNRPGSVIAWGALLVAVSGAIGLAATLTMPSVARDLFVSMRTDQSTVDSVGLSLNYSFSGVFSALAMVTLAALARWRARERPWLASGLAYVLGYGVPTGTFLGFGLLQAVRSSHPAAVENTTRAIWATVQGLGGALVCLVLLTMLLGGAMKLLPQLLPRVHWALALLGLLAAVMWTHPAAWGLPVPTVVYRAENPLTQMNQPAMTAKWLATWAAVWFAVLLARALWAKADPKRLVWGSALTMVAVTAIMTIPAMATIPSFVREWVEHWMVAALIPTGGYVLALTAATAAVTWFAWMAENGKLPPRTKLEARLGV